MKKALLLSIFLTLGILSGFGQSKKTLDNDRQENSIVRYHVKAKATESRVYGTLIDDHFKDLENLELPFVKVYYNSENAVEYDCEIEILFDELIINDEETSTNKHFPRVQGKNTRADRSVTTSSITTRAYVHQRIKRRKLNWNIIMTVNSYSNNCELTSKSFTEKFISKSVNNTLSGDESLIPRKYIDPLEQQEPIGEPLLSRREMTEEAIIRVYKKIESQFKTNH